VNEGVLFADRSDAGRQLAERLRGEVAPDAVVLGLPRGGVPVAFEVARALHLQLDVIVVRKLGVPFQPELAMGAIGEGGVRVLNQRVLDDARIGPNAISAVERRERAELERRTAQFRRGRQAVPLAGREVLIVDDGIATGSTARAACQVVRAHGARRVVLAVPVAPYGTEREMADVADAVVCLDTPAEFYAVGEFYRDFAQTGDGEVIRLLAGGTPAEVTIDAGAVRLGGDLVVPDRPGGVVVFAHGSGSSRHSPRNRFVASALNAAGVATLLMDLLTEDEELDRRNVFDVALLAQRLLAGTGWVRAHREVADLALGYFGASTAAAAALWAAAEPDAGVAAVVSRGGRPDLAGPRLSAVTAPTLLIVGGRDDTVIDLNAQAQRQLRCPNRLAIVPGATHLFEQPGALETVAELAAAWFTEKFALNR
jgi:putative phosphoribosyl transferase